MGNPRSRIFFSNYGRIVNVQAWGWHVTSCGYGDAQGGQDQDRWYTHRFSGTSSASPIVTGAAACIQSHAIATNGAPLTPNDVRKLLVKTGTPQVSSPGVPVSQHIGPQPNLLKALAHI
jgi:subtilisin family serine protease